jgi:hypothetical protein
VTVLPCHVTSRGRPMLSEISFISTILPRV